MQQCLAARLACHSLKPSYAACRTSKRSYSSRWVCTNPEAPKKQAGPAAQQKESAGALVKPASAVRLPFNPVSAHQHKHKKKEERINMVHCPACTAPPLPAEECPACLEEGKQKLLLHQQNGNDTLPCGPPADPFTGRFEALTPQEHRPQMATLHSTGTPASVSARTNACVSAVVGVRCPSSG